MSRHAFVSASLVLLSCASKPVVLGKSGGSADAVRPGAESPEEQLEPPPHEVHTSSVKIDLPAVPDFVLPPRFADGSLTVRELRVNGKKLLDNDVTVTGVITWVYDCATAIRQPDQTDKVVADIIDKDPTVCERRKFYVGDSPDTAIEKSVWVVDVPRPFNKLERRNLPRQELANPPADRCDDTNPKKRLCPLYNVGDTVSITGSFSLVSPHREGNSDGLLVYLYLRNSTQQWESPLTVMAPIATGAQVFPVLEPPPPTPVQASPDPSSRQDRQDSRAALAAGNQALRDRQVEAALVAYQKATAAWNGNHVAWYGMGGAYAKRGEWSQAVDAFATSVRLAPEEAMYQMWYGIALYERAVNEVRNDQARRENKRPDEVPPELATVKSEKALQHLIEATRLDHDLWRAHYYVGRIHRDAERSKPAAVELSLAIAADPREPNPYVALTELYRRWDYTDQAIMVAQQGTTYVAGPAASDLWYVLAMAYEDKRIDNKAIDAFTNVLVLKPDHHQARFQRGQQYVRAGDYRNARRDLEEFLKSAGGSFAFERQAANRMLLDIAAKAKP